MFFIGTLLLLCSQNKKLVRAAWSVVIADIILKYNVVHIVNRSIPIPCPGHVTIYMLIIFGILGQVWVQDVVAIVSPYSYVSTPNPYAIFFHVIDFVIYDQVVIAIIPDARLVILAAQNKTIYDYIIPININGFQVALSVLGALYRDIIPFDRIVSQGKALAVQ